MKLGSQATLGRNAILGRFITEAPEPEPEPEPESPAASQRVVLRQSVDTAVVSMNIRVDD
jgi:hypothetical protein